MAESPKKRTTHKDHYKITITTDAGEGKTKVNFAPQLRPNDLDNVQVYLNTILTGTYMSFKNVLGVLPPLRPASELEQEHGVYIFKDQEKDNELFNERTRLFDTISDTFNKMLRESFPDIVYIRESIQAEQNSVAEMDGAEFAERKATVAMVAEAVRSTESDNDGDIEEDKESPKEDAS